MSHSRFTRTVLFLSLCGASSAVLSAQPQAGGSEGAKPAQRPKYSFLRQNEDWSVLPRLDEEDCDLFDPLKYMGLGSDGDYWLSIGGSVSGRMESWTNFNFGAPPPGVDDDTFILSRAFVHADMHLGSSVRAFVEGKTAQSTQRDLAGGRRTIDADWLDLQQAFVDVSATLADAPTRLRVGRQELQFGRQRLISPLPWGNTLRTWEGLTGLVSAAGWKVTALLTRFVPVDTSDFNEGNDDELLFGLYGEHPAEGGKSGDELYWLGIARKDQTFNGTVGDEYRQTFGGRIWGPLGDGGLDGEVEVAGQVGQVGGEDVLAGMLALELGRTFDASGQPRAKLALDYATGDSGMGGSVGTFNQLYPLGHAYFGHLDTIGRQNIVDVSTGVAVKPAKDWSAGADWHVFWLADRSDALYNAGGGVVRPGGSSSSSYVGNEVDLNVTRRIGSHLAAQLGYGHFFAGDMISDSGTSEDIDFVYFSLDLTF